MVSSLRKYTRLLRGHSVYVPRICVSLVIYSNRIIIIISCRRSSLYQRTNDKRFARFFSFSYVFNVFVYCLIIDANGEGNGAIDCDR